MKLGGWMIMLTAMMLFLSIVGIPTGVSGILDKIGITLNVDDETVNADIESSTFWYYFMAALTAVAAGAIIVGFFAKGYDTSLIILPLVIWIAGAFIGTFWIIIQYTAQNSGGQYWMTSIVTLIFSVLAIGFIMACMDYFAGR